MVCVNCGNEGSDKFCSHCGQRLEVKRINFKQAWFDFWSRIYGFDGMFPRTMRDLTIRPGVAARKYIDRNRVSYYGPVGYFFLMVTLFLLVNSMLNIDVRDFLTMNQRNIAGVPKVGSGQEQINKVVTDFVSENLKLIAFLVIPFNAFVARFLFFRKSGLNYLEHSVLPFYLIGHIYWLSIISVVVYKFTGSFALSYPISLLLILYFGFAYTSFITYQSKWKAFFKGMGVYVGGQLVLITFVSIVVVIVVLLLAAINPEALELIRPSNNR